MSDPRHMTDDINHFFIRAAANIENKAYSLRSNLKQSRNWLMGIEKDLQDIEVMRAQILLVAQRLDGRREDELTVEKVKLALSGGDIDKEVYLNACDAANIISVQNEDVTGVLVVTNDSMSSEDIAKLTEFCDSQLSGTMKRIEVK